MQNYQHIIMTLEKINQLINQKRQEIKNLNKQIKDLTQQKAALTRGYNVGDVIKDKTRGRIWVVSHFNGYIFMGYYVTTSGEMSRCPENIYLQKGQYLKIENMGASSKFSPGDLLIQCIGKKQGPKYIIGESNQLFRYYGNCTISNPISENLGLHYSIYFKKIGTFPLAEIYTAENEPTVKIEKVKP